MIGAWLGWQVATVAALVLAALAVRRWVRRPELEHFVWLLVLLKLLVPGAIEVPVLPAQDAAGTVAAVGDAALGSTDPSPPITAAPAVTAGEVRPVALPAGPPQEAPQPVSVTSAALGSWMGSVLLALGFLVLCALRFDRRLRAAGRGDDRLDAEVARLGRRFDLGRVPRVLVVDGPISPALWPFGGTRLLLPREIARDWPALEREAVLLHELAHFARRDHWIRVPEALVLCVWWWVPPVWWLRRQLRRAEEAACDARAVRALGGDPRPYAEALVRTAEILSRPTSSRLPRLVTGASALTSLSQRLETIMKSSAPTPTSRSRGLVLLLGAVLLPCVPGHADPSVPDPSAPAPFEPAAPASAALLDEEPEVGPKDRAAIDEARKLIEIGDMSGALVPLKRAVSGDSSAAVDQLIGHVHGQLGEFMEAMKWQHIATRKAPRFGRAWRSLGTLEMQMGMHADACKSLRRAIDLGRGDASSYGMLGVASQQAGDLAAAESAYWMASMLAPQNREWKLGLIRSFFARERYAEGLALTMQLLKETPDDVELQRLRINALLGLERYEEASPVLRGLVEGAEAAVTDAPWTKNRSRLPADVYTETMLLLSPVERSTGDRKAAELALERALELDPEGPRPYLLQSYLLQSYDSHARGETQKALVLLRRAIALDPSLMEQHGGQLELLERSLGLRGDRAPSRLKSATDAWAKAGVTHAIPPKATPEVRAASPGRVVLRVLVDVDGMITGIAPESSSSKVLTSAAVEAVQHWRFEPRLKGGEPVPFRARIPIEFPGKKEKGKAPVERLER